LNALVDDEVIAQAAASHAARARAVLREDIDGLRRDAGLSVAGLARAAGLDPAFVRRILVGTAHPSLEAYARLTAAIGADLVTKAYPNTGPALRDRHQARILELVLGERHLRWDPFTEVGVRRPARGWIDVVLHEPREVVIVASEIESGLARLEQLIRWHGAKAESLPSWAGWDQLAGPEPRISRLLLVRRTRTTRSVATDCARQLRVAYPAHPDDALGALIGTSPWPGPALVWVAIDGHRVRFLSGR
jgi:hypothetical protein